MRFINLILFCGSAFVGSLSILSGQSSLADIQASADSKLADALSRLSSLRDQIGSEKVPLSTEREVLFTKLQQIRREADRSQRLSDNQNADLSTLEANNKAQSEVVDYLINLSAEFARSLDSQLDPSERAYYSDLISKAEQAIDDPYIDPLDKLNPQLAVLVAGLDRMKNLGGGATYPGKAIMPNGLLEDGKFARFGPVTFFASSSGSGGIAQSGESTQPIVLPVLKGSYDKAIVALTNGELATVPNDSTLGNALAIASTKESLLDHVEKGGLWVWPILGFAAISLLIALFKAFEIYTLPIPKEGTLGDILGLLSEGNKAEAAKIANAAPGPIGRMLEQGVRFSDSDPELVEEILYERIVETQPKVMRLLPFISVTAAVAPLLGLLGTVTGMINTFKLIEVFGAGDAKKLSGGISEALITTEFGLIVAIPSLLFFALLSRKAKSFLATMEKQSISFINGLKSKAPDKAA